MIINEDQWNDLNVHNGDKIILTYSIRGKRELPQVLALLSELDSDRRWHVDLSRRPSEDQLEIHLIVDENPFPVVLVLVAVTTIATGLFLYLSLDKIEVITREAPAAAAGVALGGLGIAVAVGLILFYLMGRQ